MSLRLSRNTGRPRLYPEGLEMTSLQVPKKLKEQLQQIAIALAWRDKEKAKDLID